ncbi:MAG: signal peptidase I [Oscillospiraceae bacterium]|nr:signal peptidase I [Oscillospiraceae bacterium]
MEEEKNNESANNESGGSEVFSGDIKPDRKKSMGREIWEWTYTLFLAVALTFSIKYFFFDIVRVDGPSMLPTLEDQQRLIISKFGYTPEVGDIIILDSRYDLRKEYMEHEKGGESFVSKYLPLLISEKDLRPRYYVKRVIALPGQTVDFSADGKVLIDGKELDESAYYDGVTRPTDRSITYPLTVEENRVFVMGDNRSVSKDSRSGELGTVDYNAIAGKAQFRIMPFNKIGGLYKK